MRRIFRWILIVFVLLVLVVGVLLIPAVQKSLFLTLASSGDRTVSVDFFHVGPSGLRIENLEFSAPGILARVPSAKGKFSWGALLRRQVVIRTFSAENIFVKMEAAPDETRDDSTDAGEPFQIPEAFDGILQHPIPLRIEQLSVSGRMTTAETEELAFSIEVKDLVAGQQGEVRLSLVPGSASPETVPSLDFFVPVSVGVTGILEEIRFEGDIVSRVSEFEGTLDIEGSVKRSETGESYQLRLSSSQLLPDGNIVFQGGFDRQEKELSLRLDATGENLDFLQIFMTESLPAASFEVSGETAMRPGHGFQSAQVNFRVDAERLPRFDEPLRATGAMNLSAGDEGFLTLDQVNLEIGPPEDAQSWISLRLLEPQIFRGGDSLEIPRDRFASTELFLPADFLNALSDDWKFSDFKAAGNWIGSENGITLEADGPWTVSVSKADRLGDPVAVELLPSLSYQNEKILLSTEASLAGSGEYMNIDFSGEVTELNSPKASFDLAVEGGLGVLRLLVSETESSRIPEGLISSEWKGSYDRSLELDGSLALKNFKGEGFGPADVNVQVTGFAFSPDENLSLRGVLDLGWKTSGDESSLSGFRFSAFEQDNGRWSFSSEEGVLTVDPNAFAFDEDAAKNSTETAQSPATGTGLPKPSDFAILQNLPALPLDIEKFDLSGTLLAQEGPRSFELALANLSAGEEGSFSLRVEGSAASFPNGSLEGKIRVDEDGVVSRVEAFARAESVELGKAVADVFAQFIFSPSSPVDPLSLVVRTSENGSPMLFLRSSFSDEKVSAEVEVDFASWLKSPLSALLPNLATGHLDASAHLEEDSLRVEVGLRAVTPLDGFESYDFDFQGILSSMSPLSAKGSLVLTDAKDKQSDLTVGVESESASAMNLRLSGSRVDIEAMQGFARVWQPANEGDPDESVPVAEDGDGDWPLASLPFTINATLSVGELIPVDLPAIRTVEGQGFADTEKVTLRLSANWWGDSLLSMEGRVNRMGEKVEGVVDAKATRLPIGELLRKIKPQETPPIEGLTSVGLSFQGSAPSLADLPDWMAGTLTADIENGVVRSLNPGARVTRLAGVGSIAGVLAGNALRRPGVVALGEIINLFKEVPFSRLSAKLERTEGQETVIESLLFRGPYLSMQGSGRVQAGDLDSIPTTPMQLDLRFGSKPPLSGPLDVLDLLGSNVDGNGFREWRQPIQLSGTFVEPNAGDLWSLIIGAVERAATMSEGDLRREREERGETPPPNSERPSTEETIQQGVNSILNILGR